MNDNYKYPPDTSWLPPGWWRLPLGWWRRRDLRWGVASIVLSLAPFAIWIIIGWEQDAGIGFACWPVGLILGFLGLWERGAGRKLAAVGILMNLLVPPIGFMLAPLYAGLMLSRSMP